MRDLTALFAPSSVAIVGASEDPRKYGNWLSAHALASRDVRPVRLVNRRGERVLGEPTLRSLRELEGEVELAAICVPVGGFAEAVDDALAAGARAIVGITAGFAELGEEGAALQREVVARVRAAGAVLLGPNCLGVADTQARLTLTSNPLPAGPVGLVSQSGNLGLELARFLEDHRLGFSRFASVGNQADLTAADLVRSLGAHDATELIGVYCEDFVDGRDFAAAAAEAGKPVALLTVGGSEASVRGARSHTGALTSARDVVQAACEAAGVELVRSPRELADLVAVLRGGRRAAGRRVAVIADGGGHASLAADRAEGEGLRVPELAAETQGALRALLPPSAGASNPIDLAGAGDHDIRAFARVLDRVLASPDVDVALVTGYFGGYGVYDESLARAELATAAEMARIAQAGGKPVVVQTMEHGAAPIRELERGGVPVFRAIEDATAALGRLAARRPAVGIPGLPVPEPPVAAGDYWSARELLRAGGVAFPLASRLAPDDDVEAAACALGFPLVLKALGLLHKSDAGGVRLGLRDAAAVAAAHADMAARLAPPAFSLERMAEPAGGVELIVGVKRDPRFGPVAMVGLGGIYAELLRDVAFALAPLDPARAEALLGRLGGAALLRGARGRAPVDVGAAARLIAAVTRIAAAHPEIAELEVNPLLARPDGALALDARIVLADPATDPGSPPPWTSPTALASST